MKEIKITSSGIKQAIDDLVNENELLQDKVYKQEDEIKRLKSEKEQLNSRIWETKDMIRILETNCDISDYHAQKLIQILNGFNNEEEDEENEKI